MISILFITMLAPFAAAVFVGLTSLLRKQLPGERFIFQSIQSGLLLSFAGNTSLLASTWTNFGMGQVHLGAWLASGSYEIPLTFLIDRSGISFATMASLLTWVVGSFSRTYLHRDPGFLRFFLMMGLFASGTQLVSYAGALDLLFAGWEMIGISSTLFIAFFHDRPEPIRSSIRALITYRICDVGFLLGVVVAHEWLGSTEISALSRLSSLPPAQATILSALFLVSAAGKSAQLPFSGWLARAMEGPTPSSALFYGGVSIHAGLFLLLRIWPAIEFSLLVQIVGIVIGLLTALYAASVARVQPDAKGVLAHATLTQVGLIFAEIAAGWTRLALIHLIGHALLRVWQYLRAPNTLHDAHRLHSHQPEESWFTRRYPNLASWIYAMSLQRWRVEEAMERPLTILRPIARWLADREARRISGGHS